MRTAVIILSLIGAAAALLLGVLWMRDHGSALEQLEPYRPVIATDLELNAGFDAIESRLHAAYALIVASVFGLLGAAYAVRDHPRLAGLLLLLGGVAPVVFDVESLIFTFFLILAGLLAIGAQPTGGVRSTYWRPGARGRHA